MWLITTFIAAVITTLLHFKFPKQRLQIPALMFWGSTAMILVDHILGYEGGDFIELTTDGLVSNSFLLGFYMIIPVLIAWFVVLLVNTLRKDMAKTTNQTNQ